MKYSEEQREEVMRFYFECKSIKETYERFKHIGVYADTIKRWVLPTENGKVLEDNREAYKSRTPEQIQKSKERCKRYFIENKEEIYIKHKNYLARNIEQTRTYYRERGRKLRQVPGYNNRQKERYKNDPIYKLKCLIRGNANRALRGRLPKKYHSLDLLGCGVEEYSMYLESKFKHGMTLENHGKGKGKWHIDHIIPLDVLNDDSTIEEIMKISHYTNTQPLWSEENLRKSNKIYT